MSLLRLFMIDLFAGHKGASMSSAALRRPSGDVGVEGGKT